MGTETLSRRSWGKANRVKEEPSGNVVKAPVKTGKGLGKPKRDVVYYLTIRKPGRQEEEHESVKDLSLAEDAEKCENCQF